MCCNYIIHIASKVMLLVRLISSLKQVPKFRLYHLIANVSSPGRFQCMVRFLRSFLTSLTGSDMMVAEIIVRRPVSRWGCILHTFCVCVEVKRMTHSPFFSSMESEMDNHDSLWEFVLAFLSIPLRWVVVCHSQKNMDLRSHVNKLGFGEFWFSNKIYQTWPSVYC